MNVYYYVRPMATGDAIMRVDSDEKVTRILDILSGALVAWAKIKTLLGNNKFMEVILPQNLRGTDDIYPRMAYVVASQDYPFSEDDRCPTCGWDMIDASAHIPVIEIDKEPAPPESQSSFYNCYSSTWLITCSNCGTRFSAYYSNY